MFIITGCGRSGTSAVAKLLHTAGISVGRDLIRGRTTSNADGYFEERAVIAVNDAILAAAGLHAWFSTATRDAGDRRRRAAPRRRCATLGAAPRRRGRTRASHGRSKHGCRYCRRRRDSSSACAAPVKSSPRPCATTAARRRRSDAAACTSGARSTSDCSMSSKRTRSSHCVEYSRSGGTTRRRSSRRSSASLASRSMRTVYDANSATTNCRSRPSSATSIARVRALSPRAPTAAGGQPDGGAPKA